MFERSLGFYYIIKKTDMNLFQQSTLSNLYDGTILKVPVKATS